MACTQRKSNLLAPSGYVVKEFVSSRSNEPVPPAQAPLAESFPITSDTMLARAKCRFKRGRVVREPPAPLEQALADERGTTLFSSIIAVGI